ncbi:hypothetical protein T484DRAFT_1760117 [Baffinella frigidus]|nr:hypothetical protein T484DRAFT_1760117 [Cryptophyta sp. CCMP2293]
MRDAGEGGREGCWALVPEGGERVVGGKAGQAGSGPVNTPAGCGRIGGKTAQCGPSSAGRARFGAPPF